MSITTTIQTATAAQTKLVWAELDAVTIDNWTDEDLEENGFASVAADITARRITPDVIDELHHCLTADWCTGRVRTAFLTMLAQHGGLDAFDPNATYLRRPRTMVLLGTRWII